MTWLKKYNLRTVGIAGVVVLGIVALVAFGLRTSAGGDFEFSMYQGEDAIGGSELEFSHLFPSEKPLVLNFWAGLCPPCRAEMPGFQAVYEQHQGDFVLLGLDVGPFMNLGSNQDARRLLRELNITYSAGYAHNRDPVVQFGVISMPTTLFFTPDGKLFRKREGFLDQRSMEGIIQDLLRTTAASS